MFKKIATFFSPLFKTSTRRWSGTNKHYGPFTYCKRDNKDKLTGSWKPYGIVINSSGDPHEDDDTGCHLILHLGGITILMELPPIINPVINRVYPSWDAETIKRIGRNYYNDYERKSYGFHYSEGHVHVKYGVETDCSSTDKSAIFNCNWMHDRYIGTDFINNDGTLASTYLAYPKGGKVDESVGSWYERREKCLEKASKSYFLVEDSDGTVVLVTTYIEELKYERGEKNFRWLSWFYPSRIYRKLNISFECEVGTEKGTWKGGLWATSFEMIKAEKEDGQTYLTSTVDETSESCFKRFIAAESLKKGRRSVNLTFLKNVTDEENNASKYRVEQSEKEIALLAVQHLRKN